MKFSNNSNEPKISNDYCEEMKERIEGMRNYMRDWIRALRDSREQASTEAVGYDAGTGSEENQAVEPSPAEPESSSEADVTQPSQDSPASNVVPWSPFRYSSP
jgi:hypothetical protein